MRFLAFASILLGSLPAQRTWIVDPRGGGDFLDLAPAVAAASAGDTLILRAAPIRGTVVNKGLRIVSDLATGSGVRGLLTIRDIPLSQSVILTSVQGMPYSEPQLSLLALLTNRWVIGEVFGRDDRCGFEAADPGSGRHESRRD